MLGTYVEGVETPCLLRAELCRTVIDWSVSAGAGRPDRVLARAHHHIPRLSGTAAGRRGAGRGRNHKVQVCPALHCRVDHLAAGSDLQFLLSSDEVGIALDMFWRAVCRQRLWL